MSGSDKSLELEGTIAVAEGKRYPLVMVEWRDSCSHSSRWTSIDEIVEDESEVNNCFSVGWLLEQSKDKLILTAHLAGLDGADARVDGAGGMTVPRECVVKVTRLKAR